MVAINKTCPMCRKMTTIEVDESLLEAIMKYNSGIGYIQDIPLPPNEREFIKTGYCMECQKMIFGE